MGEIICYSTKGLQGQYAQIAFMWTLDFLLQGIRVLLVHIARTDQRGKKTFLNIINALLRFYLTYMILQTLIRNITIDKHEKMCILVGEREGNTLGYFKDEHLIITGYEKDVLDEFRKKMVKKIAKNLEADGCGKPYQTATNYIPPIIETLANTSYILFVPMDGSKEGWTTSSDMDDVREWLYLEIDKHNATKTENKIHIIRVENCEHNGLSVEQIN